MSFSCGIVGLPNAGKSTIFNALTAAGSPVAAYAFCTIDPKEGTVVVPDQRLDALAGILEPEKRTPATLTFVDIAGLVEGASQGEGLGNRFLGHIREVDAVVFVLRAFEDENVSHSAPRIDPWSARRRPSTDSTVVVLPAPLGPTIPKISPASTMNEMPSTTVLASYALVRFSTSMTGI